MSYLRIWDKTNNTIFEIRRTNSFEKSLKKSIKKGLDIDLLKEIIFKLANDIPLEKRIKPTKFHHILRIISFFYQVF